MRIEIKRPPRQAAQEKHKADGNSWSKFTTAPVSDAMLARYLGVRRSRVWQLITKGDIPPPNRDNGAALYWTAPTFQRLAQDMAEGRAVIR